MNNLSQEEFIKLSKPLIKWLCDNCHPHVTIIITPTNAELLEGVLATGEVHDFLKN